MCHCLCCQDCDDCLVRAVIVAQIIDRCTLIFIFSRRYIQHFDLMHNAGVRKNTDLICVHTRDNIFIIPGCILLVSLVSSLVEGLCIAKPVHDKINLLLLQRFFFKNCLGSVLYHRSSLSLIFFFNLHKILFHNTLHGCRIVKDIFIFSYFGNDLFIFFSESQDF